MVDVVGILLSRLEQFVPTLPIMPQKLVKVMEESMLTIGELIHGKKEIYLATNGWF